MDWDDIIQSKKDLGKASVLDFNNIRKKAQNNEYENFDELIDDFLNITDVRLALLSPRSVEYKHVIRIKENALFLLNAFVRLYKQKENPSDHVIEKEYPKRQQHSVNSPESSKRPRKESTPEEEHLMPNRNTPKKDLAIEEEHATPNKKSSKKEFSPEPAKTATSSKKYPKKGESSKLNGIFPPRSANKDEAKSESQKTPKRVLESEDETPSKRQKLNVPEKILPTRHKNLIEKNPSSDQNATKATSSKSTSSTSSKTKSPGNLKEEKPKEKPKLGPKLRYEHKTFPKRQSSKPAQEQEKSKTSTNKNKEKKGDEKEKGKAAESSKPNLRNASIKNYFFPTSKQ